MMNKTLVTALLVVGLASAISAKADWIIDSDGVVTRSQILGDDSEKSGKKEERKEEKKEDDKFKFEIQKGPVQLKIEKEDGVLKVKSKNERGEEFEMETKKNEKIRIKNKENDNDNDKDTEDVEIASGSGRMMKIKKGEVEAETELPISVDLKTNELSVNGKTVTVLPDQAVRNAFASGSAVAKTKIELKSRGQETVYEITREEKKKLFGFFDFTFDKSSVVSADTGEVLENTQAWWSNLLENFAR